MKAIDVLDLPSRVTRLRARSSLSCGNRRRCHRESLSGSDPGLILLGERVGRHPELLSLVKRELEQSEFAIPRIAAASLGDLAVLWGAVAVASKRFHFCFFHHRWPEAGPVHGLALELQPYFHRVRRAATARMNAVKTAQRTAPCQP